MEMRSSSDRMVFDLYELFMKQTGWMKWENSFAPVYSKDISNLSSSWAWSTDTAQDKNDNEASDIDQMHDLVADG